MKHFLLLLLAFTIGATTLSAQENQDTITLKEVKVKGKRKRKRTQPRVELNEYKVDVNAPSLIQALRAHLGTAKVRDNRVIVLNDRMYAPTSGNPYALWVIDGIIYGEQAPPGLDLNSIRSVKVLKSLLETSAYGFRGSSGVIEITTDNSIRE
ncbi:MAG: Uncharacterised protein [Flavobacteriaceae bacterium]|nr:MAG: Uncharacterised protein [Flavobacteriaceae bacterium]